MGDTLWNNIKVSLYDLFGYFFPGAIFCIALGILFWSLFFADKFVFPFTIAKVFGIFLLLVAYLAGHLVQAIANRTCRTSPRIMEAMATLPDQIKVGVRYEISRKYDLKASELKDEWVYWLSDYAFTRIGSVDNKVIFEAREGLYKGLFVSFAALSVSLFVRMLAPAKMQIQSTVIWLPWYRILALAAICLAACPLLYQRYKRFSRYKILESVLGFLTASKIAPRKDDEE
jgi:hypothetical protein